METSIINYKSVKIQTDDGYQFESEDYYFGTDILKEKIDVNFKDGIGDSLIIKYDSSGNIIDSTRYSLP